MGDQAFEYLAKAETCAIDYSTAHLVSDEAELLRGCLNALVSIARQLYDLGPGDDE